MPNTIENLQVAFAGESQANRKYLAFARQAEKDGLPQIAKVFRAAAEAETLHALAHLANMGGIGTTLENLKAAVAGETYEFTEMYPPMVEQARAENHKARYMLGFANAAEKVHAGLFAGAAGARVGRRPLRARGFRGSSRAPSSASARRAAWRASSVDAARSRRPAADA